MALKRTNELNKDYDGISYTRTDLAIEMKPVEEELTYEGISIDEKSYDGIKVTKISILTDNAAQELGKPIGDYITIESGKVWYLDDDDLDHVCNILSKSIRKLAEKMANKKIDENFSVLIVGLGNQDITPDAIGPWAVNKLTVTRHIRELNSNLYDTLGYCEISSLVPGVLGQTGIETVELVRGAAENAKPDLVIAIDALAAKSVDRLCTTIQLSNTGISPGAGIGNNRKNISYDTIGYPVMALGVPTVVDSSTLVYDTLKLAGIDDISDDLTKILENGRSFFVSPKETDLISKEIASLISKSINLAFYVGNN